MHGKGSEYAEGGKSAENKEITYRTGDSNPGPP
jgi:hypothetical protein